MDHINQQQNPHRGEIDGLGTKESYLCNAFGRILRSKSKKTNHENNYCKIKGPQNAKYIKNETPALEKPTVKDLTSQETTEADKPSTDITTDVESSPSK